MKLISRPSAAPRTLEYVNPLGPLDVEEREVMIETAMFVSLYRATHRGCLPTLDERMAAWQESAALRWPRAFGRTCEAEAHCDGRP